MNSMENIIKELQKESKRIKELEKLQYQPDLIHISRISCHNNIDLEKLLVMTITHNKLINIKCLLQIFMCTKDVTCRDILGEKNKSLIEDVQTKISQLIDLLLNVSIHEEFKEKVIKCLYLVQGHIDTCFNKWCNKYLSPDPGTPFPHAKFCELIVWVESEINKKYNTEYINVLNNKDNYL